ncbi:thioester reductase, partial [Lysinibacillus sphaericus]|uniref:non-ribosomal peptide synthetase n=1 Tax=Lysinibacillus sphaericus TaxID=1421 RepID=UPI0018CED922
MKKVNVAKKVNTVNKLIENVYPLTPLQEGMLYHYLLDENTTDYVVQTVFSLDSKFNDKLATKALELLSERYSVLRTSIVFNKISKPQQIVLKERQIEYKSFQFSEEDFTPNSFSNFLKDDVNRGFDLQKDSLLRVHHVILPGNEQKLIWTIHHIIVDGWCNEMLIDKFLEYYDKLVSGEDINTLKELIVREKESQGEYSEYINWLVKQDQKKAKDYWRELLADYDSDCEIRAVKTPEYSDEQMRRLKATVDEKSTLKLKKYAERNESTLNTIGEMVCGIMLQAYTGNQDVVFGKVVSGRNANILGIEDMVGLFINTIPVRVKVENDTTINELLIKQQAQANEGTGYDYCSLAEIQNDTILGADLIKLIYVFQNISHSRSGREGIGIENQREQTNYAVSIVGYEVNGKLGYDVMYNPNRYSTEEMEGLLNCLVKISEEIAENPDRRVAEIETVTEDEKEKILHDFNATKTEYPREKTVVELFEEQAAKTPDQIALVFEEEEVSYRELNERANVLAHKLRELGVKPDDFVAIVAERSIEVITGIYGIIKAGAAYVPIDPTYPEERIAFMLEDCQPKAMLLYGAEYETNLTKIDLKEAGTWEGNIQNPEKINKAEDLIYCIYTSGTTGKPKGSMTAHRNAVRLVRDTDYIELNENTVILQTGSLSFDASTLEIWGAFLNGGKVVITSQEIITDHVQLKQAIRNNKVTTMFLTTMLFNQMISEDVTMFDTLRHLLIGGEKLSDAHVRMMKEHNKETILTNVYGPTENTTFTTEYVIPENFENIPIGKPISNTQVYILNGDNLCGIGVPGELCIAGDGLARGYLNRPELTAKKFVKNPFGEGRLYRSGDLARWLPDGNIEYLGRIDEQVKIRGFRIELGEVESRIREIEGIHDSAVIAKVDQNGDKALYTYYTGESVSVSEIREHLVGVLPEYMIPSYMMEIDSIPVTRNGKLDKKALPEIEVKATREYVAPSNETEETICKIFGEILAVENVGVKDSFFELGGHSLRATRLVNKIESETGYRIALKDVFSHPTPEKLSQIVLESETEEYIPIPRAEEKE